MKHQGSCHCGRIRLEVDGTPERVMKCNCSICSRKGSLLWFVDPGQLRVEADEADVTTYTFNKHVIQHHFCRTCGIHPYGECVDLDGNRMVAINIRCLEDVDPESVPADLFDGRALA